MNRRGYFVLFEMLMAQEKSNGQFHQLFDKGCRQKLGGCQAFLGDIRVLSQSGWLCTCRVTHLEVRSSRSVWSESCLWRLDRDQEAWTCSLWAHEEGLLHPRTVSEIFHGIVPLHSHPLTLGLIMLKGFLQTSSGLFSFCLGCISL